MIKYLFVFILLFCANSYAVTTNLGSCAQTTVQTAITNASVGDVLVCPSGSWSWSGLNITKDITLQGAGIGNTLITITGNGGLQSSSAYSNPFRVTGFTFRSTTNIGNFSSALIQIWNNHDFRIDNNEILTYSSSTAASASQSLGVWRDSAGVIDHNYFGQNGGSGAVAAHILWSNSGTTSSAANDQKYSWINFNSNDVLGSADHTLFIEDNTFYSPVQNPSHNVQAAFGRHGGIIVFRHNTLINTIIDNHGFCNEHGGFAFEISNNDFIYNLPSGNIYAAMHIRGGTGVIYNNTTTGSFGNGMWWDDYRADNNSCSGSNVTFTVPGYGTVAGNTPCPEGYACAEQVGRGRNHVSDPVYLWGNSIQTNTLNSVPSYIQANRDYYVNAGVKPGYVPYTYPHPLVSGSPEPVQLSVPQTLRFIVQ